MTSLLKNIRNRLCKFSGEDYTIIQRCNLKIQYYFSFIGLLVLIILICSIASALFFTENLFHNGFVDISVGLVWGYIVTNMYVLLLYTISPNYLPSKGKKKQKVKTGKFQLSFSMGIRIFIIFLLAIIIAQPLNVFLLKPNSTSFAFDIKFLLASNPFSLIITFIVMGIFLLPVYLKYSIRNLGGFYEQKAIIEKQIIEGEYDEFVKVYQQILENEISNYNKKVWRNLMPLLNKLEEFNSVSFETKILELERDLAHEKIEKYEYWANPPYCTELKNRKINSLTEKDLLNHIYPLTD